MLEERKMKASIDVQNLMLEIAANVYQLCERWAFNFRLRIFCKNM